MGSRPIRWRRVIIVGAGLFVILGALGGVKVWQIATLMAAGKEMAQAGPPPEAVATTVAQAQSWPLTLQAIGTIAGVESIVVENELPGIVTRLHFESGDVVREHQVLVELDARVERAQLAAAEARRALARVTAKRTRSLVDKNAIPKAELDADEAALAAAESDVAAMQAQLDHKRVSAPFKGRAGIRAVAVGQYLPSGAIVTTLDSVAGVWVDFTLPQDQLARLQVGMPVRVALHDQPAFEGTIAAIDPTVDAATRSIRLRATLSDLNAPLRSGMFVTVIIVLPVQAEVVVVPATAIMHAPYGDSVFVVQDTLPGVKIALQQFVRVGQARGDFVAIREGIAAGQTVVSFGAFKLRNGARVAIDNRVQPKQELQPNPENR